MAGSIEPLFRQDAVAARERRPAMSRAVRPGPAMQLAGGKIFETLRPASAGAKRGGAAAPAPAPDSGAMERKHEGE